MTLIKRVNKIILPKKRTKVWFVESPMWEVANSGKKIICFIIDWRIVSKQAETT